MTSALSQFHPLIEKWFKEKVGQPTDIQKQSWPKIAKGEHVLITAPTGSGKTLTAFLWAINQLICKKWDTGQTNVLYISPLKALNNDIWRNLTYPLEQLQQVFETSGEPMPNIRALTRSGDTSQSDRRRMLRHPPEILITTPESLNLMLSSSGGRSILSNLSTVILDEIHSVVGEKRGVHLITAVDRLVKLSGEFQRISLSATVRPMETVAAFVGGYMVDDNIHQPKYTPRPVSQIRSRDKKEYRIQVCFPREIAQGRVTETIWEPMAATFKDIISRNRSTLLFTGSRKICEKITYLINSEEKQPVAYAHHGSLSKEIRETVEQKLKAGELKAIVATSSLEMGIDIGELDEVILIQAPISVSSAIQRIGRAGHRVGEVSKSTLFPTHAHDFINAAVISESVLSQNIEEVHPVRCPLDVLAQVLVSMVGVETWNIDNLFRWTKTSYPYHQITREQFDLVLNMLAGRYADSRIRELKPRVSIDRLDNTVEARKGALLAVYMSGGTIPDRGYFNLRHQENGALIGELDEEYVWEANIGQIATIGTQNWKIQRITHNDVFAVPAGSKIMDTPFWKSEEYHRDFHFSQRISEFLEIANAYLSEDEFKTRLKERHCLDDTTIQELIRFLHDQKEMTLSDLPHRHHILLEYVKSGPDGAPGNQLVIHTVWGGQLNRPFAMALDAAWEEKFGDRLEIFPGNDCIVLQLSNDTRPEDLLSLVTSSTVEAFLRKRLEKSGYFGARFRECAGRALLITRNKVNERMPFWMTRLKSQRLLESVLQYDDFPILLETWRTCLQDEFDLENLKQMLSEIESGVIRWTVTHTNRPSPFATGLTWNQINKYMYLEDQPASDKSALRSNLLADVVFSPGLRPTVPLKITQEFEKKRQRLSSGYSPQVPRDLVDWVMERILIPWSEWELLTTAMENDAGESTDHIIDPVREKLVKLHFPDAQEPLVTALELYPKIIQSLYSGTTTYSAETLAGSKVSASSSKKTDNSETDRQDELSVVFLGEWLRFYGPKPAEFIYSTLGLKEELVALILEDLIESQALINGQLITDGGKSDVCDSQNFEILLRLNRADAIPEFSALDIDQLALFLAHYQGLTKPSDNIDGLFRSLEQLLCLTYPVELWESEILPARLPSYDTSWLDTIMQEGDLRWIGVEKKHTAFCFEPDLDLLQNEEPSTEFEEKGSNETVRQSDSNLLERLFQKSSARYDFATMLQTTKIRPQELSDSLWEGVWQGILTNDTFAALRKGIENKFTVSSPVEHTMGTQQRRRRRASGRSGFAKWKGSLPYVGNWFKLPELEPPDDLLASEELKKDRVRQLLDRYGIVFRELLHKELPAFKWSAIFRSLRLMELSGEVLAGYFFKDILGPQFISHQAFRTLQTQLPEQAIFWINAVDPASLCGLQVDVLKGTLPKRMAGTHIVYHGHTPVLISERNGKTLTINVQPENPHLQEYFCSLHHLLFRRFQPLKQITIDTINGENAARSVYSGPLKTSFEVLVEPKRVILYRKL